MSDIYKTEQLCLKSSMWCNLFCALACAIVGIYANSGAVIFDSFYCFFLSIGSLALLLMLKKTYSPPSKHFQYGYSKFEPLMVFLQASIIVVSCIYAGLIAIRDFIYPNELRDFSLIALLEFILFTISVIMYLICKFYAKHLSNQILKLQALSWWTDSLQSLALCLAFSFGMVSNTIHMQWLTPYVDPIALLFLVMSIIREPAYFVKKSLIELLDGVSPGKTFFKVESKIIDFLNQHQFKTTGLQFRKAGRKLFVKVLCAPRSDLNLLELGIVQRDLNKSLEKSLFKYVIEVIIVVDDRKID